MCTVCLFFSVASTTPKQLSVFHSSSTQESPTLSSVIDGIAVLVAMGRMCSLLSQDDGDICGLGVLLGRDGDIE
jgi:hypothetical protein